ncbi:MAG TPA: hypothetical protein VGO34_04675 [Alphaproteobacteria bacterium]|jgi:hypothetical protein
MRIERMRAIRLDFARPAGEEAIDPIAASLESPIAHAVRQIRLR